MDYHGIRIQGREDITTPGKKLSEGKHANVYEWGTDRVIKLFKASYPTDLVTTEYYNALAVKKLPFKKPIVCELKKTEFGFGIVFEKLTGENMMDYIERTGDLKGAAVMMAQLQKDINKCTFDTNNTGVLETAHQQLRRNMVNSGKADTDATKEMIRFLGTMKEGNALCHGNLHPDNVFITDEGAVAMSASNYCIGMPLFDVAKSFFLIAYTPMPGEEKEGSTCPVCRGIAGTEERKAFGRYYLDTMGKSATEIGGYLSMVIAGM